MEALEARYQRAMEFYVRGQLRLARDELNFLGRQQLPADLAWRVCQALADCSYQMGNLEECSAYYEKAISSFSGVPQQRRQQIYSNYLFLQHYLSEVSAAALAERHFGYNELVRELPQHRHMKRQRERLRIGYLSPDFGDHVDMLFFIQLLACRSKEQYEIFCYSLAVQADDTTVQLRALADHWQTLAGLPARQAADVIYEAGIDILFDLSGHAHGGETLAILAYRPAPIQLCGIGYMSTTGMAATDYFLSDVFCDPPGSHDEQFTEQLLRLPHTHLCYTPSQRARLAQERYENYTVHEGIVFGCFNNFAKITDEMLRLWLRIVRRVPGAHLLLKDSSRSSYRVRAMRQRAEKAGFCEDELELRSASGSYMEEYPDMDIALDTYPYTGGGTTCDALYMGVPVISLYGERHGSRFGYSLLQNIGLGELAADSAEAYVEKAAALAADTSLVQALHRRLRPMLQQSPVMDGRDYTREVEKTYEKIWQRWQED